MTTRRSVLLTGLGMLCAPLQRAYASEPANLLAAAEVHVAGYPTVEAIRWIGQIMARESQGRWALRMYDAGQLGRESDAADLARFGALDLVRLSLGALNNAFPATRVLSLPYSFDSVAHMRRCVDGAIGDAILESFVSRGLVGLAFFDSGARCFYNARRPLLVPADLAGMKIRVPPSDIFIATAQAFGANPTPLSYGETFSALQTHLIDGAENNWPSFHGSRHFEVARYWSQTLHSCSPDVLLMSQRRWDAMADADRQMLRRIARESIQVARTLWDAREAESRAAAVAAGVQVGEVDQAAFRAAVAPLLAEYRRDPALERQWRAIRDQA